MLVIRYADSRLQASGSTARGSARPGETTFKGLPAVSSAQQGTRSWLTASKGRSISGNGRVLRRPRARYGNFDISFLFWDRNSMCASNVLMPTKCSCRSGADWRLQSDGMPDSRLLAWALFRWLGGSPGSRSPVTSRAFVTSRGTRRGTTSYRPPTTRCVCGGREGTGPTYAFFLEPSVPLTSVCNPLLFPLSSFLFLSPRSSIFFPFCFPFSCFLFLLSSFSYPLSWPDRPAIHRVPPPGHAPGRRREHRRTDGPAEQVARGRQAAGARL